MGWLTGLLILYIVLLEIRLSAVKGYINTLFHLVRFHTAYTDNCKKEHYTEGVDDE